MSLKCPLYSLLALALLGIFAQETQAACGTGYFISFSKPGEPPTVWGPKTRENAIELINLYTSAGYSYTYEFKYGCDTSGSGTTNPNTGGTTPKPNPGGDQNQCSLVSVTYYKLSYSGPGNGVIGNYCCRNVAQSNLANYQRANPRYKFTITTYEYRTYSGGSKCQSRNTIQCVNGQVREVPYSGTLYQWRCN